MDDSAGSHCTLYCLIEGKSTSFIVEEVYLSWTVAKLKVIIAEQKNDVIDVKPDALVLWKLNRIVSKKDRLTLKIRDYPETVEMDEMDRLADYFSEPPQTGFIHIFIQLPKATLPKSSSTHSNLAPEELSQLPSSSALHKFWARSWKSDIKQLFEKLTVQRDGSGNLLPVPSTCWVLNVCDWIKELDPQSTVSGILVRDEYWAALRDILEYHSDGRLIFSTHSSMEVDGFDLNFPFSNPFVQISAQSVSVHPAAILMGHPGIGKTSWLYFVLGLRLQVGLSTILQLRSNRLFIFDGQGVRKLKYSKFSDASEYKKLFAPSTWCLLDSNIDVGTVPVFLRDLCFFFVQASSPRAERIEWEKKESRPVLQYFLKSWTASELITGRTLQAVVHSEKNLLEFCTKYGPSARLVYSYASSSGSYDDHLKRNITGYTYEQVYNIIHQATSLNLADDMSHKLTLVEPGVTRDVHIVSIATLYLETFLKKVLQDQVLETSARQFNVFNGTPKGKSTAGYILDGKYHDAFSMERTWKVITLKKSKRTGTKNTHWKLPDVDDMTPLYLRISLEGGFLSICVYDTPPPPPDRIHVNTLRTFEYLANANLVLEDGYYRPASGSEPTFDSFIYVSALAMATIIQSTVSFKHDVNRKGIEWLQKLGVKKFRYIVLSSPGDQVDIAFPNKWAGDVPFIPEKYAIVLKQFPI